MNKKTYIIIFLALILIPVVTASIREGVEDTLGLLLDATGNLIYVKVVIWGILFSMINISANRIFPENRMTMVILSLIIASAAVRFMPEEFLDFLATYSETITIIFLFLAPFLVGKFVIFILSLMRINLGMKGRVFLIVLSYIAAGFAVMKWKDMPIGLEGNIINSALTWVLEHPILALVIIGLICLLLLLGRGRGILLFPFFIVAVFFLIFFFPSAILLILILGAVSFAVFLFLRLILRREEGATVGSGLRTGAREAGQLARRGAGWFSKKRATMKQRARLKSGWKRAEQKYTQQIQKMPKGKNIKKGTPGYALLRKRQIRLAKARQRQKKKPGFRI